MGLITVIQAVAAGSVYLAAYAVRFDGAIPPAYWTVAFATLPLVVVIKTLAALVVGVHRGSWRAAGFAEVSSQAEAATLGTLGFAAAVGFSRLGAIPGFRVPLSILLMDWAGSLIVLCGARVAGRLGWERYGRFFREARKVIVVGAGDAGAALARQVAARPDLGLEVVGFLDPKPTQTVKPWLASRCSVHPMHSPRSRFREALRLSSSRPPTSRRVRRVP